MTIATDSQCTISALGKSNGLLAPFFASRISESIENLSEVADETVVNPIQHVAGNLNPADIPTRDMTTPQEIMDDSVWQLGPTYLTLPKEDWPFSRDFMDSIPEQELRKPRAMFNLASAGTDMWTCGLGPKITDMVLHVMRMSNCYSKTVSITARLMKGIFSQDRSKITECLTVRDLKMARRVQFMVSMGPTFKAVEEGKLDALRPIIVGGIAYVRGRLRGFNHENTGCE